MQKNKFRILTIICTLIIFTPIINAADITVSSSIPLIHFDDTDTTDEDWYILANQYVFTIKDLTDNNSILYFSKGADSDKSLYVNSSGDISLADASVFIDRSENRLGIGTVTPSKELTVIGEANITSMLTAGALRIHDEEDYPNSIMQQGWLNNNIYTLISLVPGGDYYDAGYVPFIIDRNATTGSLFLKKDHQVGINDVGNVETNATLYVGGGIENNSTITSKFEAAGTESVYKLLKLSANDTDGTGPSEVAFVLRNEKAGQEWLFRTIDGGKAFTATLGGTGGPEFKVVSDENDYTKTKLYIGGKLVFANGKIQSGVLP